MRILIVAPSLSGSSYMIPYMFAKVLMKKHKVKIVGPSFGKPIFINDKSVDVEFLEPHVKTPVQVGMMNMIPVNFVRLMKNDFDVVHCFKLLPHTAPVCSIAKKITGKPLVLTIDDYDKASPKNMLKKAILEASEKFYRSADEVTVMSEFLRKRYGGELIYQPVDTDRDRPTLSRAKMLRRKLGLENKIVITHVGTLFESKGIDVLIRAVKSLNRDDVKLVLFEMGKETERYKAISGPETVWVKKRTGEKSLDYTLMADIYAIPTRDTPYTRAQTPLKIFEAMSMGTAVVASDISDVPKILENGRAGLLCKPGDVKSLSESLLKLVKSRGLRKRIGKRGHDVYMRRYHYKVQGKKLLELYDRLEDTLNISHS